MRERELHQLGQTDGVAEDVYNDDIQVGAAVGSTQQSRTWLPQPGKQLREGIQFRKQNHLVSSPVKNPCGILYLYIGILHLGKHICEAGISLC
jgi:hypothetical protein